MDTPIYDRLVAEVEQNNRVNVFRRVQGEPEIPVVQQRQIENPVRNSNDFPVEKPVKFPVRAEMVRLGSSVAFSLVLTFLVAFIAGVFGGSTDPLLLLVIFAFSMIVASSIF